MTEEMNYHIPPDILHYESKYFLGFGMQEVEAYVQRRWCEEVADVGESGATVNRAVDVDAVLPVMIDFGEERQLILKVAV